MRFRLSLEGIFELDLLFAELWIQKSLSVHPRPDEQDNSYLLQLARQDIDYSFFLCFVCIDEILFPLELAGTIG